MRKYGIERRYDPRLPEPYVAMQLDMARDEFKQKIAGMIFDPTREGYLLIGRIETWMEVGHIELSTKVDNVLEVPVKMYTVEKDSKFYFPIGKYSFWSRLVFLFTGVLK